VPRPSDSGPAIGEAKETLACGHLQAQGLRLIERNYRCRLGEIDLIMQDGACLVFVEVRYRRGDGYGSALESVTAVKRRRILSTAQHYLQQHPTRQDCRFDEIGRAHV
jgi:putative endonuclease